jgi:hypothetical protein
MSGIKLPTRRPDYIFTSGSSYGKYWFDELIKEEVDIGMRTNRALHIIDDEVYAAPLPNEPFYDRWVVKHNMYPQVEVVNDAYRKWVRSQTEKYLLGRK